MLESGTADPVVSARPAERRCCLRHIFHQPRRPFQRDLTPTRHERRAVVGALHLVARDMGEHQIDDRAVVGATQCHRLLIHDRAERGSEPVGNMPLVAPSYAAHRGHGASTGSTCAVHATCEQASRPCSLLALERPAPRFGAACRDRSRRDDARWLVSPASGLLKVIAGQRPSDSVFCFALPSAFSHRHGQCANADRQPTYQQTELPGVGQLAGAVARLGRVDLRVRRHDIGRYHGPDHAMP